jgi:NAD(P)H-hydrate repair Nnr-like enzyme with NAD(P)H-hydrate dehydratase domain
VVEKAIHSKPRLIVDALFGIGLNRELAPTDLSYAFDAIKDHLYMELLPVVSIDVPSGLSSESGCVQGFALPTALTVTFHRPKRGHFLGDGPTTCSRLRVVDIGLRHRSDRESVYLIVPPRWPTMGKSTHNHKYSHGHALILSGPSGRGGAARLAARGALRIGAGLVTVGCPPEAIPENAARLDAVMLRGVADGLALEEALADPRINALCAGPGLGLDARGLEVVAVALGLPVPGLTRDLASNGGEGGKGGPGSGPGRGLVLDADALTILSQHPDLFAALHKGCVLTPHAGEFARLFPDIAEKLSQPATKGPAYSKVDATREAAKRAGCVVLCKGPDTVIAGPDGRCAINSAHYDRAAPWLATAGSGDVLAGFITGLLARGFSPFDAACTGAWLHVECALSFGPGLIAEDLPEELPKVFRTLGL